ncbi:hypothetical protein Y032_0007g3384 [Ancylostoma ceylanicum]|uniref:Sema domain-containing protein n=1 Tax=Ancylostoma ceylanicum TaxID=53326 RepID=A0A016VM97_9BILA|nr:hypothetical protein Y032_0007g3384 [Ancylostoma ceylanicum]
MIVGNRQICRCSIHTGQSTNYIIDYDITAVELRQSSDLYLLTDSIAVLVTYNPENYQFSQYVLALNDESENAVLTMKRTVTLPALNSSLTIGTGLLSDGYILVTGYTGPADDHDRHVVAMMIAADPYKASSLPNKDITSMIGQFEHFLQHSYPDLRIFAPGIFAEKDGLIFMLKRQVNNLFCVGAPHNQNNWYKMRASVTRQTHAFICGRASLKSSQRSVYTVMRYKARLARMACVRTSASVRHHEVARTTNARI